MEAQKNKENKVKSEPGCGGEVVEDEGTEREWPLTRKVLRLR